LVWVSFNRSGQPHESNAAQTVIWIHFIKRENRTKKQVSIKWEWKNGKCPSKENSTASHGMY